jgi:streptogramin lyase
MSVSSWNGMHWSRYALPPGGWGVRSLLCDSRGRLWCGRDRGNISLFDGKSWTDIYPDGGGVLERFIFSLLEDRDGNIWVGADNGIGVFDGKTWKFHLAGRDLPFPEVNASIFGLVQDETGMVWTATGNGILSFDGKAWKQYASSETGATTPYTLCCELDSWGRIWFGTLDGAVCCDHGRWKRYAIADGLCSNNVRSIRQAPDGSIWFGTESGISVLREDKPVTVKTEESAPAPLLIRGVYPNPFNPSTTITFTLPQAGHASLTVYDVIGRKVADLTHGFRPAGRHTIAWNAKECASGVYFAVLKMGKKTETRKMLLVR